MTLRTSVARAHGALSRLLRSQHIVVVGDSADARELARQQLASGHSVAQIVERPPATPPSWQVAIGPPDDPAVLEQARSHHASLFAVFGEADIATVQAALALNHGRLAVGSTHVPGLVFLDDLRKGDDLLRKLDAANLRDVVPTRVISVAGMIARRLLRAKPLSRFWPLDPGVEPCVAIVGCNRTAEELAAEIVRFWPSRDRPRLLIVAPTDALDRAPWLRLYPGLPDLVALQTIDAAKDQSAACLVGEIVAKRLVPCAIYICPEKQDRGITTASRISEGLRQHGAQPPPIYVEGSGVPPHVTDAPGAAMIEYFGENALLAACDVPALDQLDSMPRALHDIYVEQCIAAGETMKSRRALRPWSQLPEDLKEENRVVADQYSLKVAPLRCHVVDEAGASVSFHDGEIDGLAWVEHDRWCKSRVLLGWRRGPRDDEHKLHPDIVPYDDLLLDARKKDEDIAAGMAPILARVGKGLRRDLHVAITYADAEFPPPADRRVARCALRRTWRLLRERFPDRFLIARTTMTSLLERALASLASQGPNSTHWLYLSAPLDAIAPPSSSPSIRQRIFALACAAERLLVVDWPGAGPQVDPASRVASDADLLIRVDSTGRRMSLIDNRGPERITRVPSS